MSHAYIFRSLAIARQLNRLKIAHENVVFDLGALTAPGMRQKVAAAAAVKLMRAEDSTPNPAEALMIKLANVPDAEWEPAYDELLAPAYKLLAQDAGPQLKSSTVDLSRVIAGGNNILQQIMMGSHGAVAAALAASLAAGSGIGALNWHLKRQTAEDDGDNAELAASLREMRAQNRTVASELGLDKDPAVTT